MQTQETLDALKSICGSVHITKGDCDEASSAPEDEVLAIGDLKVGLCHGHQVRRSVGRMRVRQRRQGKIATTR